MSERETDEQPTIAAGGSVPSAASDPDPARMPGLDAPRVRIGIGDLIGPYRIVDHLGSGGMGTVFLAEQQEPVQRKVALKVVSRRNLNEPEQTWRLRFRAEQQAMARLSHPSVAALYDSGETDRGEPYFVMEYVAGRPITDDCDERRLDVEERLRLFVAVCRGVQHAHHKGVLHRDIKPANVMVTEIDEVPTPKVIDFGIAKGVDRPLAEVTQLTGQDSVVGTLAYLSPEVIAGAGAVSADMRSDVYALGILLHELLVGVRPFDLESGSTA